MMAKPRDVREPSIVSSVCENSTVSPLAILFLSSFSDRLFVSENGNVYLIFILPFASRRSSKRYSAGFAIPKIYAPPGLSILLTSLYTFPMSSTKFRETGEMTASNDESEKKELSRVPHLLDDAGSHPSPGGSFSASTPVSCSDTSDRPADSEPAAAGSKGTEEASSADRPSPSAPSLPKFFCFGGIPRNVGSFPFSWDLLLCGGNNIDPLRRFFHGNGKVFLFFF